MLDQVRLDRGFAQRIGIATLLLLWPLILIGRPAYFVDSTSYLRGGTYAATYAARLVTAAPPPPGVEAEAKDAGAGAGASASASASAPAAQARGARSIPYSIAAWLLAWPRDSMTLLAVVQSLAVAFQIALLSALAGAVSRRRFAAGVAVLALASPVAVFANYAMPDIFAGIGILAAATLTVERGRLSRVARSLVMLLLAVSATVHASHLPLLIGLIPVCLVAAWRLGQTPRVYVTTLLAVRLAAPPLAAVALTMASAWIGYGQASLAAKRFPLTLARSIEDGPARWLLQDECRRPRYAVCEVFGTDIPDTVTTFLWKPTGLDGRATPEQFDRVRAEEQEIVLRAARRYRWAQARSLVGNIWRQLGSFGFAETYVDQQVVSDRSGEIQLRTRPAPLAQSVLRVLGWATILSTVLGMAALLLLFRRLRPDGRALFAICVCGLVFNAAICATFSGVADRYQARVVWLVPLLALLLAVRAATSETSTRSTPASKSAYLR